MPLDPSIALSVRPVQLADPSELQSRALTLRNLALQSQAAQASFDQAQQERQHNQTLGALYKSALGENGQVDRNKLYTGVAQSGLGARIPALQKSFADADKVQADIGHTGAQTGEIELKMLKQKVDIAGGKIASLLAKPNVSTDDVIGAVNELVQQKIYDQKQGAGMVRMLPGDPRQLRQFLLQKGLETMDASKRMEMLLPKLQSVDNGKQVSFPDFNPITNPGGVAPITKTTTPGEDLSAATTRMTASMADARARSIANMTDARERQLAATGVTYQQDDNGNLVALPTKAAPGSVIRPIPTLGADGKPIAGKSSGMTEDQGKATGWLVQASNAFGNMQKALKADAGASGQGLGDIVARMPYGEAVGQYLRSAERQQFIHGASSLGEAILRAATGAGVNHDEAVQKTQELTPQLNDKKDLIDQKMAAIPLYLKSLEIRAGKSGTRQAQQVMGEAAGGPAGGGELFNPAAIAAELANRGQK